MINNYLTDRAIQQKNDKMKNPFNYIKRKADKISKSEKAMRAGVELAAKAKAEGWSPEQLMEETMRWTDRMIRRELDEVVGKDIDKMVEAMLQNTPEAKAHEQQLRQEVRNELFAYIVSGKEPDLQAAAARALGVSEQPKKPSDDNKPTMTIEELEHAMAAAASVVKLICGVGNNAAWLVVLEAYDHAKQHRRFNQSIKGGKRVGWYFRRVMKLYHEYEHRLVDGKTNRMFHLADMDEQTRRKYGDGMTDREYYDFWAAIGGPAYTKTHPLVTSLWNKYRLSLQKHDVVDADKVAWVMTAQAALELAGSMYDMAIDECEKGYGIPRSLLQYVFGQFSMKEIAREWYRAMMVLAPETDPIKPSELDEKNIDMGIRQLMDAWMDHDTLYASTADTVANYDEVFRTAGFQKKVLREIAEVREETKREYEKMQKGGDQ